MTKKTQTHIKIIHKFYELVMWRGYAGTSVSDIAQRCSISKASIYHYMDSKVDLFNFALAPDFYGQSLLPFKLRCESSKLFELTVNFDMYPKVKALLSDEKSQLIAMKALLNWHHYPIDPFLDKELIITEGEKK